MDGTVVVPNLFVQMRVDTAVQEVVGTVTVTKYVVTDCTVLVVVAMYDVYHVLVVMFEKVNVIMIADILPLGGKVEVVVTVIVTGPCIGFSAGAFSGTRTPSAARVTQTITRALIASCLFKSVPSRCWA